jgi:hypothetical protein
LTTEQKLFPFYPMPNDPTPFEVQAAMIADLTAKLKLSDEAMFYTASQNAALRVALTDLRASGLSLMERSTEADWYAADLKVAIIKADIALDGPPYSV